MAQYKFTIDRIKVLDEARKATEYVGKKTTSENGTEYARIRATQAVADDILTDCYKAALLQLVEACVDFAPTGWNQQGPAGIEVDDGEDTRIETLLTDTLTLTLPKTWNSELLTNVVAAMEKFATAVVTSEWLGKVIGLEVGKAYAEDAATHLATVTTLLYQRSRPTRFTH